MSSQAPGTSRKVGQIAAAAGLTIRTLHYYEEIALLTPSGRSPSGHRLYDDADVERLFRICTLRRLGLALADIGSALDDPAWDLPGAVAKQLEKLEARLEAEGRLRNRLRMIMSSAHTIDDLLTTLEETSMLEPAIQHRISTLVYADLDAAFAYLTEVFALGPGEVTRDTDGRAVHGEVEAGDGVIWLHPESEQFQLASPRSVGAATASVSVLVDDVDAHHEHAREAGATIVYGPTDQPYGYREYGARDPEGHMWSFMRALD